jgi:hypothetical protein
MQEPIPEKVSFQFIKGAAYHVLHADGAYGGLTPRGNTFVCFYSERQPIPESVTHVVGPNGLLGDEIESERKVKPAVIREVDIGVMMDIHVTRALHQWLGNVLAEHEKLASQQTKTPREVK